MNIKLYEYNDMIYAILVTKNKIPYNISAIKEALKQIHITVFHLRYCILLDTIV